MDKQLIIYSSALVGLFLVILVVHFAMSRWASFPPQRIWTYAMGALLAIGILGTLGYYVSLAAAWENITCICAIAPLTLLATILFAIECMLAEIIWKSRGRKRRFDSSP